MSMLPGLLGTLAASGVDVTAIDTVNEVLEIAIPKDSYNWKNDGIKGPEDYARRIKDTFCKLGIFNKDCIVNFTIKDIYWTKEMENKIMDDIIENNKS